eukprot:75268-Chlamydomonas_euryale.AAC.1
MAAGRSAAVEAAAGLMALLRTVRASGGAMHHSGVRPAAHRSAHTARAACATQRRAGSRYPAAACCPARAPR